MDKSALSAWWKLIRTVTITAGLLLSAIAVVELIRVYVILRDFSSILGLGFVIVVAGALAWVLVRFFIALRSLPQAPPLPEVSDPSDLSAEEIDACAQFLRHRISQLGDNPSFSADQLESMEAAHSSLCCCVDQKSLKDIYAALNNVLEPLDREAELIVRDCVRDVMLAVALSPYRSADLLIVLYRNGQMILQLARLYQTRPAPIEQFRILKDVVAIVAAVNFLNFTEKLVEQLLERVPVLGQLAGDVSQGFGAGLLTSAAGHAAIHRCKSIDPWNRNAARERLAGRMSSFAKDVKSIFSAEVLPKLRPRVPDFTSVPERISSAFDSAVDGMGNWVWRPVKNGGSRMAAATIRGSTDAWRKVQSGTGHISRRGKSLLGLGSAGQAQVECKCPSVEDDPSHGRFWPFQRRGRRKAKKIPDEQS
ncbi:MAG: YcjF family protein [Syntrophobacteraceae bacterium]